MQSVSGGEGNVSIVMPVWNAAATIGLQLDALVDQDWSGPLEVVIADNGSTDSTRELVMSYVDRLPLRLVDASDMRGPGHALNVGLAQSSGEFLLFLHGDDVVDRGYVSAMVAALKQHAAVAARLELDRLNEWHRGSSPEGLQSDGLSVGLMRWLPFGLGASIGVRRTVALDVGPFDVDLPRTEDVDFCYRLQLSGYSLTFVPEAVLHYRLRASPMIAFRQSKADGQGAVCLYTKYRSDGMPRRGSWASTRFLLGAIKQCVRARTRADVLVCAHMLGFRVGLLTGSIRYRVVYL